MQSLYFLHIPKTAGTSLDAVLRRAYPPFRWRHLLSVSGEFTGELQEEIRALRSLRVPHYISGHLGWLSDDCLPSGTLRCTMLREPIARTISHLRYVRLVVMKGKHFPHPLLDDQELREEADALKSNDFLHILQSPKLRLRYTNIQCLHLSYTVSANRMHPPVKSLLTSDDLSLAQTHLEQIDVVGITERFDDSVQLICAAIGQPIRTTARLNVTPEEPGINRDAPSGDMIAKLSTDPATQRKLAELLTEINEYDLEVYATAKQRFATDFARFETNPPRIRSSLSSKTLAVTWDVYETAKRTYRMLIGSNTRKRIRGQARGKRP